MGEVTVEPEWSASVRRAAGKVKADLSESRRRLQLHLEQGLDQEGPIRAKAIEEALALAKLFITLGYSSKDRDGHGLDAVDLELEVHSTHPDASRSYFRAVIAHRKGVPLGEVYTKEGRLDTREEAEAMRREHMGRLSDALGEHMEEEGFLSADYIPWVRRQQVGRRRGARSVTTRPRLPGESRLTILDDRLEHLLEEDG